MNFIWLVVINTVLGILALVGSFAGTYGWLYIKCGGDKKAAMDILSRATDSDGPSAFDAMSPGMQFISVMVLLILWEVLLTKPFAEMFQKAKAGLKAWKEEKP